MLKWKSLMVGAATFVATHAIIVAKWDVWFGGAHEPWFLNGGNGPLELTAGCLCVATIIAAALEARTQYESVIHGVNVAVGATIAAAVVLLAIGPGTLFPIVIAFCGGIAFVSTIVGAAVVAAFHVH
jgi:hypothetical protein